MLTPGNLSVVVARNLLDGDGHSWLLLVPDLLIALACFAIPILLLVFAQKWTRIRSNGMFTWLAAFLFARGVTIATITARLWLPPSRVAVVLTACSAMTSLLALTLLVRMSAKVFSGPAPNEMGKATQQMASVLESTRMGVIAMDSQWKIDFINCNAKELLKVDDKVRGLTLWNAFPAILPPDREALERVMETRQPGSYEGYYQPLDLTTTAQAHPWDDGGLAIFFSDISEQKRLQRELDWERVMREQRIEVLARLSGEVAHEIRNPLAIIHARASDLVDLAKEVNVLPSELVSQSCNSIVRTSDRAIRILRGVAALAREGRRDPMEMVSVSEVIQQTVELVHLRYRTHSIVLETVVPDGLPEIECREVQIGQVLMNLLNNAFDAVDESADSERWVRIAASLEPALDQPAGEKGRQMVIDVIDGGPELTAEVKAHLMETFYTTKRSGFGMGIGLSVSRAIAEDHGGTLELREADGHTCLRLSLPLVAAGSIEKGLDGRGLDETGRRELVA